MNCTPQIRIIGTVFLALTILLGCTREAPEKDYLLRVDGHVVTVGQFLRSVEAAGEEAFPGERSVSAAALQDLQMRVLNQLSEELMIAAHADSIGVSVSDAELSRAVDDIKADYPDDTFAETLLENAVSFETWKQKLAMRMLVDKVVEKEIVDKVEITSTDVAAYIQAHYPDGAPGGENADVVNQKIVRHLRHQKAEQMYPQWIEQLRQKYPVDVNQKRWTRLVEAKN